MEKLAVGDFNEDVSSKNIQEFDVEMWLCDALSEAHEDEERNRDGTFEHWAKYSDHVLES